MTVKAFEIRDRGTFIPAIGILMVPSFAEIETTNIDTAEAERYLIRCAGFGFDYPNVILCRMEASGVNNNATYDAYAWGQNPRTMLVAHLYIQEHWDELKSGDVICVETILGERETPKISERLERQNK